MRDGEEGKGRGKKEKEGRGGGGGGGARYNHLHLCGLEQGFFFKEVEVDGVCFDKIPNPSHAWRCFVVLCLLACWIDEANPREDPMHAFLFFPFLLSPYAFLVPCRV